MRQLALVLALSLTIVLALQPGTAGAWDRHGFHGSVVVTSPGSVVVVPRHSFVVVTPFPRRPVLVAPQRPVFVVPPPLSSPFVAVSPAPRLVWVPGFWGWTGVQQVWVPGHWFSPSQSLFLRNPCE